MRKLLALVGVGMVTVLLGCGGSQQQPASGGGASSIPITGAVPMQPPGEVVGGKVIVEMKDLKFNPENLTIPEGATVIWVNADNVAHTVTKKSGPGPSFDSGPIEPGGTYQQSLPKQGRVKVVDKVRESMNMVITVEKQVGNSG